MFTLITCNLTILSGILRQAKDELKFLQHILEHKIFMNCVTRPCPRLPYQMFLTALAVSSTVSIFLTKKRLTSI